MKKIVLWFGIISMLLIISFSSCATKLPAFDPSLPDSETAILFIPQNILIVSMDDTNVGWASGKVRQVRIPEGKHKFYVNSKEKVMVYKEGMEYMTGYNFITVKKWVEGNISYTFKSGNTYIINSEMYNNGTFESQRVVYEIKPYTDTYPKDVTSTGIQIGLGTTWDNEPCLGVAIPLKFPNVPIFWGLNIYSPNFIGLSGDYLFTKRLFPSAGFFGYVGIGLGAGIQTTLASSNFPPEFKDTKFVTFGRVPIGISWLFGDEKQGMDLYLQVNPTLGTPIPDFRFPYGSWSIDFGLRMYAAP